MKLSEFYIAETVDSLFHLCGCGNHHDYKNNDVLGVGTADVDEDHVALYLRCYDCGLSWWSYVLDV